MILVLVFNADFTRIDDHNGIQHEKEILTAPFPKNISVFIYIQVTLVSKLCDIFALYPFSKTSCLLPPITFRWSLLRKTQHIKNLLTSKLNSKAKKGREPLRCFQHTIPQTTFPSTWLKGQKKNMIRLQNLWKPTLTRTKTKISLTKTSSRSPQ